MQHNTVHTNSIYFYHSFHKARDLMVLCQLFFLPADHGAVGLQLLEDFFWLKRNANSMIPPGTPGGLVRLDFSYSSDIYCNPILQ